MKPHVKALAVFTEWFGSAAGVWQTTAVTLAVVAFELANRAFDPHAFLLMAILTVYSAVTQPALAHSAVQASAKTDQILAHLQEVAESDRAVDSEVREMLQQIADRLSSQR